MVSTGKNKNYKCKNTLSPFSGSKLSLLPCFSTPDLPVTFATGLRKILQLTNVNAALISQIPPDRHDGKKEKHETRVSRARSNKKKGTPSPRRPLPFRWTLMLPRPYFPNPIYQTLAAPGPRTRPCDGY